VTAGGAPWRSTDVLPGPWTPSSSPEARLILRCQTRPCCLPKHNSVRSLQPTDDATLRPSVKKGEVQLFMKNSTTSWSYRASPAIENHTCHRTQMNVLCLNPARHIDTRFTYPRVTWKVLILVLVIYLDGLSGCQQSPIQVVTS